MEIKEMRVVSVDDNLNNLLLIEAYCKDLELNVQSYTNPQEALIHISEKETDIILVDYMMPDMNGIDFIRATRRSNRTTPIIMITAAGSDQEVHTQALESGANDFLPKPLNVCQFKARVSNLLQLRRSQNLLEDRAKLLEEEVRKASGLIIEREHETLQILGKTAEFKDPETASHVSRVAHYSKMLAAYSGLSTHMQDVIFYASPFHDIGKVGIPDSILLKPGRLDEAEFDVMKTHAEIGYQILKSSRSEYLQAGAIIALSHHEKFDGSGYPKGLSGQIIPIFGRIVAIADVFDALTSKRPYKEAWSFDDAISFLEKESEKHFDPKLVALFKQEVETVKKIYQEFQE